MGIGTAICWIHSIRWYPRRFLPYHHACRHGINQAVQSLVVTDCMSTHERSLLEDFRRTLMKVPLALLNNSGTEWTDFVFAEEITASFRRFGPLIVDWPHKAESKSYFPPKGQCCRKCGSWSASVELQEAECTYRIRKVFWIFCTNAPD